MAKTREDLQTFLEEVADSKNVYFQPPPSLKMQYPAIVYSLNNIRNNSANNGIYLQMNQYSVTDIDEDPDSELAKKVSRIPTCVFDRHFTADNLNHFVHTISYY